MRKEIEVCDFCGKQYQDSYAAKGIIKIRASSITVTDGRRKDGCAKSGFCWRGNIIKDELLFCNENCLIGFLNKRRK
jgi:hypothetical protein